MFLAEAIQTTTVQTWVIISLTVFSVLLIPAIVVLIKGAINWTHTSDKLDGLVDKVEELITDKSRVHAELLEQMRVDREATDRRLRYIESFWMDQGRAAMLHREDYEITGSRTVVQK